MDDNKSVGCCIMAIVPIAALIALSISLYAFIGVCAVIAVIMAYLAITHNNGRTYDSDRARETLEAIDSMSGGEFEYTFASILRRNGYSDVSVTSGSGDNGIDVLAKKDNKKIGFQCKRFMQRVGNKAVQEAYTGKQMYHLDVAVVVTNSFFTESAVKTANETGVRLWDRDTLKQLLGGGYSITL